VRRAEQGVSLSCGALGYDGDPHHPGAPTDQAVYIREFVAYIDAVESAENDE
jgi:hypothetical protein